MVGRTTLMLSLLLAASLLLSGCAGNDPSDAGETDSLDATPKAGAGTSGSAEVPAGAESDDAERVLVDEPFSWDGNVGTIVGACAVVTCQYYSPSTWDSGRDLDGIVAVGLTLTWDTTATPELGFGLATACDGGCDLVTYDFGASPLHIDASNLDPDHTYRLVAYQPYRCHPTGCGTGGAMAGVEATFHVEGLTTVVAS